MHSAPSRFPEDVDPLEARKLRASLVASLRVGGSDRVRSAMLAVPRHAFVPEAPLAVAYADHPVPIGYDQTISQPTIVAMMTEALDLRGGERVLEIGTGCGYQTAVLSLLAAVVFSVEVVRALGEEAKKRLHALSFENVETIIADGYAGWPERAPFDRIIVTAAPPELPRVLFDQLADGGILVAPVGCDGKSQRLFRFQKRGNEIERIDLGPVRFVPMIPG